MHLEGHLGILLYTDYEFNISGIIYTISGFTFTYIEARIKL